MEFEKRKFLIDILNDFSPLQCILKAPQIGMTTINLLKTFYVAKKLHRDIVYCVDTKTEALTKRGFLSYDQITLSDELLTLSLDGKTQWSRVKEIFSKDVTTTMYDYSARNFNALTTHNHRWIVHNKKGDYRITTSEKLHKENYFIPKIITNDIGKEVYSDDYVRLLAWVFSEGTYPKQISKFTGKPKGHSIHITQSEKVNADKCVEIRRVLKSCGVDWKERPQYNYLISGCIDFKFAFEIAKNIRERFPDKMPDAEFACSLSSRQAKIFIETFVSADGWIDKSGTPAITQKNKKCVDIINMIAVIAGYSPSVVKPSVNNCYTIRMTQFPDIYTSELKPKIIDNWRGIVWCPRTDAGTFYARRNGRCYWTGNTLPTETDVREMAGGKINRIIAQNPLLKSWTKDHDTIEQKSVGGNIIYYRGCVDKDTEILTENGWCKYGQVSIGDKLPTLNISSNAVEMDSVIDMTSFQVDENLVRIETVLLDQLITKDHRCAVTKRRFNGEQGEIRIVMAKDLLNKTTAHIPLRHYPLVESLENNQSALYKIVGWVIGDGSYLIKRDKSVFVRNDGTVNQKIYETKKVCIYQADFCEELERDLEAANISFFKKKNRKDKSVWVYQLSSKDGKRILDICPDKKLTHKIIFNCSTEERKALYSGLMMSDGNNYKDSKFYQNKGITTDSFQALMVLLGRTTSARNSKKKNILVSIKQRRYANITAKEEHYKGIVWCPTTNNGTIFIRRNGVVSVTGQCFTARAAMMVSSQLNAHDEVDASDQMIITQYETRQQAESGGWRWYWSHPSLAEYGIDVYWNQSDQKHWFITCPKCLKQQFMSWPESINKLGFYQCKHCSEPLEDSVRQDGLWVPKYNKDWQSKNIIKPFSGYWINQMMCSWITAEKILKDFNEKPPQYFYNYVLGLPYSGGDSKLTEGQLKQNCTGQMTIPEANEPVVMGVDTGLKLDFVIGNKRLGLFYHGDATSYSTLDDLMRRWPKMIAVVDAGGDLIGSRAFYERFKGRVFLCYFTGERKTNEIAWWGEGERFGEASVDRERVIQWVVDEFRTARIPLQGTREDWHDYYLDWANLSRIKQVDPVTRQIKGIKWVRNGRDHRALATCLWRIGLERFPDTSTFVSPHK